MLWLSLLALMILVAAAPGISMYLEHLSSAGEVAEPQGDPQQPSL